MRNTATCLILLMAGCASAFSQNNYLKAGDVMPDYEFKHVYNNNGKPVKISDFKGKLLILDFWSTSCQSCIESWPKLNKLQTKYGDKIKILLVNAWQDSLKVATAFRKWESANKTKVGLSSVYSEKPILNHFDIAGVPYVVWIGPSGIVSAITRGDVLNEVTIDSFLSGKPRDLPQVVNERYNIRSLLPYYINGNGGGNGPDDSHVLWQSVVGTYSPKMGTSAYVGSFDTLSIVCYSNCLVVDMLRFILDNRNWRGLIGRVPSSRVELRVSDTTKYVAKINGEYAYKNFYAYNLWTNRKVPYDVLRSYALDDIKRTFGIDFWWEKQKKKCLVLSAFDTTKLAYNGSLTRIVLDPEVSEWSNLTLDYIIYDLTNGTDYYYSKYPLVNEANFKGNVGRIRAECRLTDHVALDRELRKYGLRFTLQEREIDVLVISEKEQTDRALTNYDYYPR